MMYPALFFKIALALVLAVVPLAAAASTGPVTVLTLSGAIGPASADYASRGISRAAREGSQLVVLKMDTPGGLDTSMRMIVQAILASPIPVATYVAPGGARAASAGTYILYASHIAAMAPGTNLGAATPVQVGAPSPERDPAKPKAPSDDDKSAGQRDRGEQASKGDDGAMTRKQVNDAAAYIRGLAQLRGRNADWAERAVREAVSLAADEALSMGVIEYVAADLPALTAQLDGKSIRVGDQERRLQTKAAPIIEHAPDWRVKILATITDPSIALLLMTIGIYGLLFEFMNPGTLVPGVLGTICLLIGLYALQLLPVNYAGLALILLGVAFMIAEAFLPSFGILGLGGVAAFVTGALILIDTDMPGFGIPISLIVGIAAVSALTIITMAGVAIKTRRRATVSGLDHMTGGIAEVLEDNPGEGWVHLHGETWRAVSSTPLRRGQQVRVVARRGLLLEVIPIDSPQKGE